MKKHLIIPLLFVICFIAVSCATSPVSLEAVATGTEEVSIARGITILATTIDELDLAVSGGKVSEGEANVLVSLGNNGETPYNFNESDITIYYGNMNTNTWTFLQTWSAKKYYEEAYKAFKSKQFWTALSGALSTLNASMGSYSRTTVSSGGYSVTVNTHRYNYSDVAMAGMMADFENAAVKREGEAYLNYIENNLLYSSTIRPSDNYTGWLIFKDMGKKGPDYKIELLNKTTGKTATLYFSRSDKEKLK